MKLTLATFLAATLGICQVETLSQRNSSHLHLRYVKPPNTNDKSTAFPKLDLGNMDRSTSPLKNFYQFVNGGWLKKTSLPSGESFWDTDEEITKRVDNILNNIITEAAKTRGNLIGDMFNLGMNEQAITTSGLKDIVDLFDAIKSIQNKEDVLSFLGTLHSEGLEHPPFFSLEQRPDLRNTQISLAHLIQGGLGLRTSVLVPTKPIG